MGGFSILGLSGPEFLGLYAIAAVATLAIAFFFIRASDPTRGCAPPRVPTAPDAIGLAYLAGGVNAVIRTILFDLRQRGFVAVGQDGRLELAAGAPSKFGLDTRASRILAALSWRPQPGELFADKALAAEMERLCAPERDRLSREDLLAVPEVARAAKGALAIGSMFLLGLAGAKLAVALSNGHRNVIFLIMLAVAAEIALWATASSAWRRQASAKGRAYLEAIKRAYSGRLPQRAARGAGASAFDAGSLFLVSLFGYEALKHSSEAEFGRLFQKSSGDGVGSCGSSGDSGGDGGGGCGGCGGGGGD